MTVLAGLAAAIVVAGAPAGARAAAAPLPAYVREAVLASARHRLGQPFSGDCSGYVLAALRSAGVSVRLPPGRSRSESLHRASRPIERPRPGDLAFFDDTYDRNGDGRANDPFTHVALVESVDGAAVVLLHRGGRGVERIRMNLERPSDPDANDPVRARRTGDAPGTRVLAGELFTAFGELLRRDVTQMLQASPASDVSGADPATDERDP